MDNAIEETAGTAPVVKNEVTNEQLNALREQIKQKDDEARSLQEALTQEQKARRDTGEKLSAEVTNRFTAQESAIENAILAATAEIDGLEKQQTQLMEEGKFGEASKISRLIASAQYRLDGAQASKHQLGTYKQNAQREAEVAKSDPLAQYSEAAKSWIRKNPSFLSDKKTYARAIAAHNLAEADDIAVDSPEYFARLDEAVRPKAVVDVNTEENTDDAPVQRVQPKSSSGAPVSRGNVANGNSGNGKQRIQLTADQAEAALISFPRLKPEEAYVKYAENIQKLKESGRM